MKKFYQCREFLRGIGYAYILSLNDNKKIIFLDISIYNNKGLDDYYFLNEIFYNNFKSIIENFILYVVVMAVCVFY